MCRIDAVLDRALVVTLEVVMHESRTPAFLTFFRYQDNRRALFFRQVAKKREHDTVTFLDRIRVDARATRNPRTLAERRDLLALTIAGELPAMVRALNAVTHNLAAGQRSAAVHTGVAETPDLAVITDLDRFLANLFDRRHRIPEIDIHRPLPRQMLIHRTICLPRQVTN